MKKREFLAGLVCGALLFSGGSALAALTAEPSRQSIYVDGQQVPMTAYAVEGHNYVQLRDIGRAVGFNVAYDAATDSVQIDTSRPYQEETPVPTTPAGDDVIVIPQSDENFILKEGDKVLCDDGTIYEIKDVSRFDKSMFAEGPLPPLPTPTCDWSQFPKVEDPTVEARRITDQYGDDLFILNLYETRRMQYTLYNLIGSNPETWENGAPKLNYAKTGPLANVYLTLDETWTYDSFWPWKESNISNLFNSRPVSQYHVQAWDHYKDGVFLYTEYMIQSF